MIKYNLLPNDALILSTVKHFGISLLASFDEKDYTNPCRKEKIKLVKDKNDLEKC